MSEDGDWAPPADERIASLGPSSILIVDDQPLNVRMTAEALGGQHLVRFATSGPRALEIARGKDQPDLILLDVLMPGMDGFQVCRLLKDDPQTRDIPVIFLTGQGAAEDEVRGLELGAADFITKPIRPSVVRARVGLHLRLRRQTLLLEQLAHIDGLTEIPNRRSFDDRLEGEWRRCAREQLPLSLLMVDIDYFKRYNDQYGHSFGDDTLRRVAQLLRTAAQRPGDHVARYGGEEFAALLPDTNRTGATRVAERFALALEQEQIAHLTSPVAAHVTASVGSATILPDLDGSTPRTLLVAADTALYEAKHNGRRRHEHFEATSASQERAKTSPPPSSWRRAGPS